MTVEKLRFEQYFVKKGMKAKEIHADFQKTSEDSTLSYSTVAKWTSEFKFGRESLDVIHAVMFKKYYYPRIYHKSTLNGHGGSSTESARDC